MVLEITLHDGPNGPQRSEHAVGIAGRNGYTAFNKIALWEITVTLMIRGPESWWKQARKYFPEIVWLRARPGSDGEERRLEQADFEEIVPAGILAHLNGLIESGNREALQTQLPDSFLRTGLTHTTMETLATILRERGHYNGGHWYEFCRRLGEIPKIYQLLDRSAPAP
ncbi:MAG: hypothetical protein ACLFR8_06885 [Alkalispirochaeta sp.]